MNKPTRVGIFWSKQIPQSFKVYASNILKHLPSDLIEPILFDNVNSIPENIDVIWDIRSGGGNSPLPSLLGDVPVVVTVHGFAPISLSGWDYFKTIKGSLLSRYYSYQKLAKWRELKHKVSAIIAVSEFTKSEVVRYTGIPSEKVFVCRHAVDTDFFHPKPVTQITDKPYFFHISNNEPRKNVARIVEVYQRLSQTCDCELILKLPNDQAQKFRQVAGVKILSTYLSDQELADLYRGALGFIFPSLYEGFGLPILEAMACGCPVITSNTTACQEVADKSALTIDPYDKNALYNAMLTLVTNSTTRQCIIEAGYQRVDQFSWAKSALCHANIFKIAASKAEE